MRAIDFHVGLGLRGVKFHPSLHAFAPDEERYWPIFAACQRYGLVALFHTGTSGIGAGQPGGQGIRLDYSRPIRLDAVAAAHPDLTVVAAHFGWPWHLELVAMAVHKTNLYLDISGWSPRRVPAELIAEIRGRLSHRFLWGSDFPFLTPERCLDEITSLGLPEAVLNRLPYGNAARILGHRLGGRCRCAPGRRPRRRRRRGRGAAPGYSSTRRVIRMAWAPCGKSRRSMDSTRKRRIS